MVLSAAEYCLMVLDGVDSVESIGCLCTLLGEFGRSSTVFDGFLCCWITYVRYWMVLNSVG